MKNVSGSEIATLGRVAKESPEQVRTLQPGVLYEYGDHWVLELVCDVLQVTNKHAELKMKTTFDGRPVTTATARYRDDSCPTIRLVKSSEVSYIDAWGKTIPVFENPSEFCPPKHTLMPGQFLQLVTIPSRTFSCSCVHHAEMVGFNYLSERTLVLHVSTNDPKLSAKIDGTVTVQVKAAYTLQLLSRLANKLGIPEDHKIKLMYPDPDFGELCLLTSLAELEDESSVTIKLVDGGQANHSAVELQQLSEYQGFLKQVPLFAALNEREIVAIAEHLVEEVFADGHAIISEGHPGETMYILKSGTAVATKVGYDFELEYRVGDFFGELALLTPNPRAASIHARGDTIVLTMYRSQFMLLVGKAHTLLQRNKEMYTKVNASLISNNAS